MGSLWFFIQTLYGIFRCHFSDHSRTPIFWDFWYVVKEIRISHKPLKKLLIQFVEGQTVIWLDYGSISKLREFTVSCKNLKNAYALRISFFSFLRRKIIILLKKIEHCLCAFIAWWKPRQYLWEFSSRWKPSTESRIFTDLLSNSPKRSPRFSSGYEGTEKMFYFLTVQVYYYKQKLSNIVIYFDFHWTKRVLWLVDSWSRGLDQSQNIPTGIWLCSCCPCTEYNSAEPLCELSWLEQMLLSIFPIPNDFVFVFETIKAYTILPFQETFVIKLKCLWNEKWNCLISLSLKTSQKIQTFTINNH